MGQCKDEMTPSRSDPKPASKGAKAPTPAAPGRKGIFGAFGRNGARPKAQEKFRDFILSAENELKDALASGELSSKFEDDIVQAETQLLRLVDVKEEELGKEKGSEEYNRLALVRMNEMGRQLQHIRWALERLQAGVGDIRAPTTLLLEMMDRHLQHIGEIADEYKDQAH